jgi:hypothetical protein
MEKKESTMKAVKTLFAGLTVAAAMASSSAWADQPGADWISMAQAQQTLKAAGYTQVSKIEADDGHWEGEGYKQDGKKYEFHIDPHSNKIIKDEIDR